eukprot:9662813-Prorocentrum_lima.AAC.1
MIRPCHRTGRAFCRVGAVDESHAVRRALRRPRYQDGEAASHTEQLVFLRRAVSWLACLATRWQDSDGEVDDPTKGSTSTPCTT